MNDADKIGLYECKKEKFCCTSPNCIKNGGECFLTTNIEDAIDPSTPWWTPNDYTHCANDVIATEKARTIDSIREESIKELIESMSYDEKDLVAQFLPDELIISRTDEIIKRATVKIMDLMNEVRATLNIIPNILNENDQK